MAASRHGRDLVRAAGALLTSCAVVGAMAAGGTWWRLIDLPSAILVLGGGWLAWQAMAGRDRRRLADLLREEHPTPRQLARGELLAVARRRAYWAMGLLGTLISAVQLAGALDDPAALGPRLAVFFHPLLTAALADLLLASPAISRVRQLRIDVDARTPTAPRPRQPAAERGT
jgi:flagellar motor component MotA